MVIVKNIRKQTMGQYSGDELNFLLTVECYTVQHK